MKRTWASAAVLAALLGLLAGCASEKAPRFLEPQGSGVTGRAGDVVVQDAQLRYDGPIDGPVVYRPGATARLRATIVNTGQVPDRLVSVRSPVAAGGKITGDAALPPGRSVSAGQDRSAASGTSELDLALTDLRTAVSAGRTYPVVLTFARAGELRLDLPVANPHVPRTACPLPPNGRPEETFTAPLPGAPEPPRTDPVPECSSLLRHTDVTMLPVDAPLEHPMWATAHDELLGLVGDGPRRKLVAIDPETGETVRSHPAPDAESFDLISEPVERVALPDPSSGRVLVLDSATLNDLGAVPAGPSPSEVTVQDRSGTLFALSTDGSTVTAVDYEAGREKFRTPVAAGTEATVESDDEATDTSTWIISPDRVTYLTGPTPPPPNATRALQVSGTAFVPDDSLPRSAYLAPESTARVLLLDGRAGGGLDVSAATDIGSTVEHVAADPEAKSLYAVTDSTVDTLRFDTLAKTKTTEYRSAVQAAGLGQARITDVTVGDSDLYLAVEGVPFVVKVRK